MDREGGKAAEKGCLKKTPTRIEQGKETEKREKGNIKVNYDSLTPVDLANHTGEDPWKFYVGEGSSIQIMVPRIEDPDGLNRGEVRRAGLFIVDASGVGDGRNSHAPKLP